MSKGIAHPDFYGDLVYKLRRFKDTPNFISSGFENSWTPSTTTVWPIEHREDYKYCVLPSTALYRHFLKDCTLTNKAVRTIWKALSNFLKGDKVLIFVPLWLSVGNPSAIRPELASRREEHSLRYSDVTIYIFLIYNIYSPLLYVHRFLWPLCLGWLLICCLYKEVSLQIFKCVSFWLHGCCWVGRLGSVSINHTSWVAVVTPTDRPKSVRNCCVIELFCGVVCVVTLPFWYFCWCRGVFHRADPDLLLCVFFQWAYKWKYCGVGCEGIWILKKPCMRI